MKRIGLTLLALAALFFAPAPKDAPIGVQWAEAQSACQYIAYGAVLTSQQWNSCFQSKADAVGAPFLPLAGGTMTGELITAASVTSSAGFNLPPGTAPSSPSNGDLWTTSGGIYARIGGTTYDLLTPSVSLVGGSTPITGTCTTTYFLYNNGGTLGCQAINSTITANSTPTSGFGADTLAYSDGSLIQATSGITRTGTGALNVTVSYGLNSNAYLSSLGAGAGMLSDSTTATKLTVSYSTDSLTSRTNYADFTIDTGTVANAVVLGTNRGGTSTWGGLLEFQVLGTNKGDFGVSNGSDWTFQGNLISVGGVCFIQDAASCVSGNAADYTLTSNSVSMVEVQGYLSTWKMEAGIKFTTDDVITTGTVPTGTTGTCSASSFAGGATAGTFVAATCAAGTYILTFGISAPTGWVCVANDRTTVADTVVQTATAAATATFKATTASSDVIQYACRGY